MSSNAPIPSGPTVADAQLVDATHGWALLDSSPSELLWTNNGGISWTNITPPSAALIGDQVLGVDFESDTSGWVATSDDPTIPPLLSYTSDAGQTWTSAALPAGQAVFETYGEAHFDFVDPTHGWIDIDEGTDAQSTHGILFGTTNGGITWTQLSTPVPGVVRFITDTDGWLIGGSGPGDGTTGGGGPTGGFFMSHDGGATWQQETLPPPAVYESDEEFYIAPDHDLGPPSITAATFVNPATGGADAVVFYESTDAGVTWSVDNTYVVTASAPTPIVPYQIIGPSQWVVAPVHQASAGLLAAPVTYTTGAAGNAWTPMPNIEGTPGLVASLSFGDMMHGWTLVNFSGCTDGKSTCYSKTELYGTQDGGATWSLLKPMG
jgi:hypothetical protein